MRIERLLGVVVLPLLLVSCAGDAGRSDGAQERMDKARAALERQGYEFSAGTHGHEGGWRENTTGLPPEREAAAVFLWCEGVNHGPTFSLDGVDRGSMPCSEDGQLSEVVADYPSSGEAAERIELRIEQFSERVQWAFAIGVTPEEETGRVPSTEPDD